VLKTGANRIPFPFSRLLVELGIHIRTATDFGFDRLESIISGISFHKDELSPPPHLGNSVKDTWDIPSLVARSHDDANLRVLPISFGHWPCNEEAGQRKLMKGPELDHEFIQEGSDQRNGKWTENLAAASNHFEICKGKEILNVRHHQPVLREHLFDETDLFCKPTR